MTGLESSTAFASSSESQFASLPAVPSPNALEDDRNMLMSVDRNPICTPSSSGMPPPSSALMTPFYPQTAFHTPLSMPMTPFGPPSSALTRGGVLPSLSPFRNFADLSDPRRGANTIPTSAGHAHATTIGRFSLVMPSYTPFGSQREMFNLTLPRGPISQGQIPAASASMPQFNMTVVPPTDRPRDPSPADDYVNASYVQPLGTRKRYIATQGPLPATFVDFWT